MKKVPILRRLMALLLVLVLFGSLVPAAFAAESTDGLSGETTQSVTDPPEETTPAETPNPTEETGATDPTVPAAAPTEPEETVPNTEATEPTVPSTEPQSAEPTAPAEEPQGTVPDTAEPTVPEETVNPTEPAATDPETDPAEDELPVPLVPVTATYALARAATMTITQKHPVYIGTMNFNRYVIYTPNPNYVTLYYSGYSDPTITYFTLSDGSTGFCLQPWKSAALGDYTQSDWWNFDREMQRGIALALAYGAPNNGDTSEAAIYATQALVWDMAMGYRMASGEYAINADNGASVVAYLSGKVTPFERALKNHDATWGAKYDEILAAIKQHGTIPSFTVRFQSAITDSNTITLKYDAASGLYKASVTDTNGVLSHFNYSCGISGVTFAKSGNTLTITATAAAAAQLADGVYATSRGYNTEVGPDCVIVWKTSSDAQLVATLPGIDPVPSTFKVTAEVGGDLTVKKTSTYGAGSSQQFSFRIYCPDGTYLDRTLKVGESVTLTDLQLGTYTVGEWFTSGWECTNAQATTVDQSRWVVDVTSGGNVTVTANNEPLGSLTVKKTSSNSAIGTGSFRVSVYNSSLALIADKTIKVGDSFTLTDLQPGNYYVREWNTDGWVCTTTAMTTDSASSWFSATVKGGEATVTINNDLSYGKISIKKATNTGTDLDGWQFGIFSDAACKTQVSVMTTDSTGSAESENLPLATYYVKEIGDTEGRFGSEAWVCDTTVQEVTVVAGQTTALEKSFVNDQYGKIKLVKTMDTDGPLAGWQFKITDSTGAEVTGSPFTTDEGGNIDFGSLLPGDYTVEEIFPDGSPFYCKSENPQTVTVKAGETAQVSFTNALRPGQISIEKVNFLGEHLAGAKFLLEWSTDGTTWTPVTYSDKEDVVLGGCTSEGLTDGCLVTGADGIITFAGLYPSWGDTAVQYRLTEVEAPEGYQLLADYAFTGELPVDEDLTINLTVYNSSGYTLPSTAGIIGPELLGALGTILAMLALALAVTLPVIHSINGKKRR